MNVTIKSISMPTLQTLAKNHIDLYDGRIKAAQNGATHIRVSECEQLLKLWTQIHAKALGYLQFVNKAGPALRPGFTDMETSEISDAITCGDYDDMWTEHDGE